MKYSSLFWGSSGGTNKHVSICESPGWICFDMLIELNDGILTGFPFFPRKRQILFLADKVTDNADLQLKERFFGGFPNPNPSDSQSTSFHVFLPGALCLSKGLGPQTPAVI